MEYLLTNISCDLPKSNSIYYTEDFSFSNNALILKEGYFSSRKYESLDFDEILTQHPDGIYNYLKYIPESNELIFTNDKLGKMPVYYYHSKNNFAISNQPWKIIRLINDVNINQQRVLAQLYYYTIPSEKYTFIDNLYKIPAASVFRYNFSTNKLDITQYWRLNYDFSGPALPELEALERLDQDLHRSIDRLQKLSHNRKIALGNSSGFDSRLMALYCKEHGLDLHGFTVCNPNTKLGFKSYTHKNANRIADYLGFQNQIIDYHPKNIKNRILLDVRNNPFDISQFFKNPYLALSNRDIMVTGQHGALVGAHWSDTLNKTNSKYIRKYFKYFFEKHKAFKNKLSKLLGKIFSTDGLYSQESILDRVIQKPKDKLKEYLDDATSNDFINLFMYYYLTVHDRYGYNAGFESINRTISSFYFYYPFVLENTFQWKQTYFNNRYLLKKLLNKKDPYLAQLPNSDLERINDKSVYQKLVDPIKLTFRSTGINFSHWVQDQNYITQYKKIINRPNPIFDEIVDKELLLNKKLYKEMNGGGDFLKVKVILDIIYYEEYNKLDKKKFYMQ